jgi:hypothetical protein
MDESAIREVLARAQAIQAKGVRLSADKPIEEQPAVMELVDAAEEAGIERTAVLQALHEREPVLPERVSVGSLVFAPSSDGEFYVAHVLAIKEGQAEVKFGNGSRARVYGEALRPFSLLPGESVMCDTHSGWRKSTVEKYDPKDEFVRAKGMWGNGDFRLDQIKMYRPAKPGRYDFGFWLLVGMPFFLGISAAECAGPPR